ncbi:MAG: UDP-N-acetylmuramate dehydrogenase, partial [Pseudomonadales bacterium]
LKPHCTLALACRARQLITVRNEQQIIEALRLAQQRSVQPLIMGEGSNIVLAADTLDCVLHIASTSRQLLDDDEDCYYLKVAAGENWNELVDYCVANHYYGIENLALIPGSVGAAPVQNIGAYGVELHEFVHELSYIDTAALTVQLMSARDCQFAYRDSIFKQELKDKAVISSVTFKLAKKECLNLSYAGVTEELQASNGSIDARQLRDAVVRVRQRKLPDPATLPNAGSFFKNPIVDQSTLSRLRAQFPTLAYYPLEDNTRFKLAAAWLIDQAGWKGHREGNVGVHEHQALVLINYGSATGAEVLALAADIQASVMEKFSVSLDLEPRVYR